MKDSEIKIGVNIGKAGREDRGIAVYTRNILREFGQMGTDCRFVLLHYPESVPIGDSKIKNLTLQPLPYSEKHRPISTMFCEQFLNPIQQVELGLDVVWHPHNRGQFIVPVGYVCTMHDILPITNPELTGQYLNNPEKRALYSSRTYAANKADMIITGSEFSRKEIINYLGSDPNKVIAIYYGIDQHVFNANGNSNDIAQIKEVYSLPDRYLLTTGSYAPHKNQKVLLDAYSLSGLSKENIGLVVVGPNDATGYRIGYEQLKRHVEKMGLQRKVTLLPSVPLNHLVSIYNGAMVFTTASLHEGFGFTPLEAMACGVPVVVSNTSAIPEVCGEAALYAHPRDASDFANQFDRLLEDNDLREKLILAGRKQVEKFNWRVAGNKTLDVLLAVAKERR